MLRQANAQAACSRCLEISNGFYKGHEGAVNEVKFSPNSQLIATVSRSDKTVRIWTREEGIELKMLSHLKKLSHNWDEEGGVDFSPDSRYLVTYNFDNVAQLWDRKTGEVYSLDHTDIVYGAVFGPTGEIATYSRDGMAKLWTLRGEPLQTLTHDDEIYDLAFSPDGTLIATASKDQTAKIWDRESGAFIKILEHHGIVDGLVFSHNGNQLITYSRDHTAILWNKNDSSQKTLNHDGPVNGAVFSPDDNLVVTYSKDKTAVIWTLEGEKIDTLRHQDEVHEAIFHIKGKHIATRSKDKTAILWESTGAQLFTAYHDSEVYDLRFHPSKPTVITRSKDSQFAQIWRAANDHFTYLLGHQERVKDMAFTKDLIATADYSGQVKLWSLESGHKYQLTFKEHLSEADPGIYQVDASHNGQYFLSASNSDVVWLWDNQGKPVHKFNKAEIPRFSPTQELFAIASNNLTKVTLWNFQGTLHKHKELSSEGAFDDYQFSPNGQLIATTSDDGFARIWRVQGEDPPVKLPHQSKVESVSFSSDSRQSKVESVSFSPDSSKLVTGTADGIVRIWSVDGELLRKFPQQDGEIKSAEFSKDGKTIATRRHRRHDLILWNLTGQQIATLTHDDEVNEFWISPDRNNPIIATSSMDKTVKLWSKDGRELESFPHQAEVNDILFSRDGSQLITVTNDTDVKVWKIDGEKLYTHLDTAVYLKHLITESCKALQSYLANLSVEDRIRRFCHEAKFSE